MENSTQCLNHNQLFVLVRKQNAIKNIVLALLLESIVVKSAHVKDVSIASKQSKPH
jgi:hypothetical protein